MILSVSLDLVLTILVTIFSRNMAGLFGVSSDAKTIIGRYFEIIALGYILNCITQSFVGELNGLQQQVKSMIFMAFYFLVLRLPLARILSLTALGVNGISLSIAISFIVPAFIAIVFQYKCMNKKLQQIVQAESSEVNDIEITEDVIAEIMDEEKIDAEVEIEKTSEQNT